MGSKVKIIQILKKIETSCKTLKQDLSQLKMNSREWREDIKNDITTLSFAYFKQNYHLIPLKSEKITDKQTKRISLDDNDNDKENKLGITVKFDDGAKLIKQKQNQGWDKRIQIKSKRFRSEDLKNEILKELRQLKIIEERQNLMRKENERIKVKSFQSKTKIKGVPTKINKSIDKEKENTIRIVNSTNQTNKDQIKIQFQKYQILKSKQSLHLAQKCINQQNVINSQSRYNSSGRLHKQSQMNIENNKDQANRLGVNNLVKDNDSLRCPKNHQYFNGQIDNNKLPDGSGHLVFCCQEMQLIGILYSRQECQNYKFYTGGFKNGKFSGVGTLTYHGKGEVKYVGEFLKGKRHGKGSLYCQGKAQYGVWQNDIFIKFL